jgi:hypothetical protein
MALPYGPPGVRVRPTQSPSALPPVKNCSPSPYACCIEPLVIVRPFHAWARLRGHASYSSRAGSDTFTHSVPAVTSTFMAAVVSVSPDWLKLEGPV